jgi:putative ABC transport system permease protein
LLKAGSFSKNATVVGCEPNYPKIKDWHLQAGSFFDQGDLRRVGRVAVLGYTVAQDLFGRDLSPESLLGRRLLINRVPFVVIGVLAERGQGLDVANEDSQVFVPLSAAMRRLTNIDYLSAILFEVDSWQNMDATEDEIADVLRSRHRAGQGRDDFQVQNQKTLIATQDAAAQKLGRFVRWIGISGLVVAGLGGLAVTWISVKERTVEIGTRRALGATSPDIFFQILFETSVVSLLGAAAGLVAGWESSRLLADWTHLPFVFDVAGAGFATAFGMATNLTFAILPSRRAARINPIRALRFE